MDTGRVVAAGALAVVAFGAGAQEILNLVPAADWAEAQAVSDGGLVVGGDRNLGSDITAYRWSPATGAVACPPAPGGGVWWYVAAVTRDGGAYCGSEWGTGQVLLNAGGTTRRLKFAIGQTSGTATDLSDDGQMVVGYGKVNQLYRAERWTPFSGIGTGLEVIEPPAGFDSTLARGCSGDGKTLAIGVWNSATDLELPYVWTEAGGYRALDLPAGTTRGSVTAISRNGRFAVGRCVDANAEVVRQCRWDLATGVLKVFSMTSEFRNLPLSVSEDGATIVASDWIWRADSGMRTTRNALEQAGLDLTGWVGFMGAWRVSPDGSALVGRGFRVASVGAYLARGLSWCAPTFVSQPVSELVAVGETAQFAADVGDPAGVSYQWYRAGVPVLDGLTASGSVVGGATTTVLSIANVGPADAELYVCRASKSCGSTQSVGAKLTVNTGCGVVTDELDVGATCLGGSQVCGVVTEVSRDTCGVLKVEYITAPTHCSNVGMRFFVDGVLAMETPPVGPGVSTGVIDLGPVASGVHVVGMEAIGETGGCNSGEIETWGGKLRVTYCVSAPGVAAQPADVLSCVSQSSAFTAAFDGGGPAALRWQVEEPGGGVWRDLVEGDNTVTGGVASLVATRVSASTLWLTPGGGFDAEFGGAARVRCVGQNACGTAETAGAELRVCVADRNCDRTVDLLDFFEFFNCWDLSQACADLDGSGEVDLLDFFAFFNAWDRSC